MTTLRRCSADGSVAESLPQRQITRRRSSARADDFAYFRTWQLTASVLAMARGRPEPTGRPGPATSAPRGPHPDPVQVTGAGGGGPRAYRVARPLEQACDISPI